MRCLALARGLMRRGHQVTFLTRTHQAEFLEKMRTSEVEVEQIPPDFTLEKDGEAAIAAAKEAGNSPVIVVDWYEADAAYYCMIREAGLPLVVIDDLGGQLLHADVVVNPSLSTTPDSYKFGHRAQLLLGPRYALVSEGFILWRGRRRPIPEKARHLLVTLGATDPREQTAKVVEAIGHLGQGRDIETIVVTGIDRSCPAALDRRMSGTGRLTLTGNASSMAELMAWADLAISGGGATCWELACMGVPNIIMVLADNQRPMGEGLSQAGVSVNLGWYDNVRAVDIVAALERLMPDPQARRAMSEAGRSLVDGRGVDRVVQVIELLE